MARGGHGIIRARRFGFQTQRDQDIEERQSNPMPNARKLASLALTALMLTALPSCANLDMPALMTAGQLGRSGASLSLPPGSFDQDFGLQLANTAYARHSGGTGWCYQYVAQAIHAHLPAFLSGEHAYLAAEQLALSPAFTEIRLSPESLSALPAGAVVVWEQGRSPSGHISIADGQGREISDHVAPQMLSHYGGGGYRVFLPAGR